jgi:hypothetical protein
MKQHSTGNSHQRLMMSPSVLGGPPSLSLSLYVCNRESENVTTGLAKVRARPEATSTCCCCCFTSQDSEFYNIVSIAQPPPPSPTTPRPPHPFVLCIPCKAGRARKRQSPILVCIQQGCPNKTKNIYLQRISYPLDIWPWSF